MDAERNIEIGDILPVTSYSKKILYNQFYNIVYGVVVGFTGNNNPRVVPIYHKYEDTMFLNGNVVVQNVPTYDKNAVAGSQMKTRPVTAGAFILKRSKVCMNAYPIANKEEYLKEGKRRENYNNILNIIRDEQKTRKTLQSRKKAKVDFSL